MNGDKGVGGVRGGGGLLLKVKMPKRDLSIGGGGYGSHQSNVMKAFGVSGDSGTPQQQNFTNNEEGGLGKGQGTNSTATSGVKEVENPELGGQDNHHPQEIDNIKRKLEFEDPFQKGLNSNSEAYGISPMQQESKDTDKNKDSSAGDNNTQTPINQQQQQQQQYNDYYSYNNNNNSSGSNQWQQNSYMNNYNNSNNNYNRGYYQSNYNETGVVSGADNTNGTNTTTTTNSTTNGTDNTAANTGPMNSYGNQNQHWRNSRFQDGGYYNNEYRGQRGRFYNGYNGYGRGYGRWQGYNRNQYNEDGYYEDNSGYYYNQDEQQEQQYEEAGYDTSEGNIDKNNEEGDTQKVVSKKGLDLNAGEGIEVKESQEIEVEVEEFGAKKSVSEGGIIESEIDVTNGTDPEVDPTTITTISTSNNVNDENNKIEESGTTPSLPEVENIEENAINTTTSNNNNFTQVGGYQGFNQKSYKSSYDQDYKYYYGNTEDYDDQGYYSSRRDFGRGFNSNKFDRNQKYGYNSYNQAGGGHYMNNQGYNSNSGYQNNGQWNNHNNYYDANTGNAETGDASSLQNGNNQQQQQQQQQFQFQQGYFKQVSTSSSSNNNNGTLSTVPTGTNSNFGYAQVIDQNGGVTNPSKGNDGKDSFTDIKTSEVGVVAADTVEGQSSNKDITNTTIEQGNKQETTVTKPPQLSSATSNLIDNSKPTNPTPQSQFVAVDSLSNSAGGHSISTPGFTFVNYEQKEREKQKKAKQKKMEQAALLKSSNQYQMNQFVNVAPRHQQYMNNNNNNNSEAYSNPQNHQQYYNQSEGVNSHYFQAGNHHNQYQNNDNSNMGGGNHSGIDQGYNQQQQQAQPVGGGFSYQNNNQNFESINPGPHNYQQQQTMISSKNKVYDQKEFLVNNFRKMIDSMKPEMVMQMAMSLQNRQNSNNFSSENSKAQNQWQGVASQPFTKFKQSTANDVLQEDNNDEQMEKTIKNQMGEQNLNENADKSSSLVHFRHTYPNNPQNESLALLDTDDTPQKPVKRGILGLPKPQNSSPVVNNQT